MNCRRAPGLSRVSYDAQQVRAARTDVQDPTFSGHGPNQNPRVGGRFT